MIADSLLLTLLRTDPIRWEDLGLSRGFELGPLTIRYYALGYVVGILLGYWHLNKMVRVPGSPMNPDQAADLVMASIFGIILGGRLGYATFYEPHLWTSLDLFKVWQGGMSFHGGVIGVLIAIGWTCWRHRLPYDRVGDWLVVNLGFGIFLVRLANFVNAELWGRTTDVPWAVVFPGAGEQGRHPSQVYEAILEGLLLGTLLLLLFWRTTVRQRPGFLAGVFLAGYGVARFIVEYFREPDAQLADFAARTGLHMGQWLCLPMIAVGLFLIMRALRRPPLPVPTSETPEPATA